MKTHRLILKGAIHLLPAHLQARYTEQWQADLEGAQELGMSRTSIVGGAFLTALTMNSNYHFAPLERAHTLAHRARWSIACGLALAIGMVCLVGFVPDRPAEAANLLPKILAILTNLIYSMMWLLVAATPLFFAHLLAIFLPPKIRPVVYLLIPALFIGAFIYDARSQNLGSTTVLWAYFTPFFLSLLIYLWARLSILKAPLRAAVASQAQKTTLAFTTCWLFTGLMLVFALAFLVLFPYSYAPYSLTTYWQLIGEQPYTLWAEHWLIGTTLTLLALLSAYLLIALISRRAKTAQGVIGTSLALSALATLIYLVTVLFMVLPSNSYNSYTDELGGFALIITVLALVSGVFLLLAPRSYRSEYPAEKTKPDGAVLSHSR